MQPKIAIKPSPILRVDRRKLFGPFESICYTNQWVFFCLGLQCHVLRSALYHQGFERFSVNFIIRIVEGWGTRMHY